MNSEEFLKQALSSEACPPDFESKYEYFRKYQNLSLNSLREFHRVCEKNNINYHVTYGSLIGIIRDGGQIPWDYDVDVFVPVSDKDKLIEALKKDLSDDFYAMSPEFDENCRHYILRICPKGYDSAAIHVDVFYFCGAPKDERERKKLTDAFKLCAKIRYSKFVNVRLESEGNAKRFIKYSVAKLGSMFFNGKLNDRKYQSLLYKYPMNESNHVVTPDIYSGEFDLKYDILINTELKKVNGDEFRIPTAYEQLLSECYGDYMNYPPVEKNINQVLHACKRFRYFEQNNSK